LKLSNFLLNFYNTSDLLETFRHTKNYLFKNSGSLYLRKSGGNNYFFEFSFKDKNMSFLDKNNMLLSFLVIKQKRFVSKFLSNKVFNENNN
jgi:hypothetical protein